MNRKDRRSNKRSEYLENKGCPDCSKNLMKLEKNFCNTCGNKLS